MVKRYGRRRGVAGVGVARWWSVVCLCLSRRMPSDRTGRRHDVFRPRQTAYIYTSRPQRRAVTAQCTHSMLVPHTCPAVAVAKPVARRRIGPGRSYNPRTPDACTTSPKHVEPLEPLPVPSKPAWRYTTSTQPSWPPLLGHPSFGHPSLTPRPWSVVGEQPPPCPADAPVAPLWHPHGWWAWRRWRTRAMSTASHHRRG
jgi:hypothetical protein